MKKKLFIIIPILIISITVIFVYNYYYSEDEFSSLTIGEKRWVEENKESIIDINIVNDYPLYASNGEGILFDFIDDIEKNVGLEFNKIPYLKNSEPSSEGLGIEILDNDKKLSKNDLLIFEDYYIAIGKNYERLNKIEDIKNKTFGVFESDFNDISYYLKSGTNLSYNKYTSIDQLYTALEKNEIDMIIIPNIMYLNKTIENDKYSINYYFTEMKKQIVLSLDESQTELNKIITKYYDKWKTTKYIEEYNKAYLDYYYEMNNVEDKDRAELSSKSYTYGYIDNLPYEGEVNGMVAGIAGEYIDRIERLANISFKYEKYDSLEELEKAIKDNKVDIYFNYYNIKNDKYLDTVSTFIEDYVVLGKQEDNHIVSSLESLKDKNIIMLNNDSLYDYFKTNSQASIKTEDSISNLEKEAGTNMIVMDEEKYNYYKDKYFRDYNLLYNNTMMNDYNFKIKEDNKAFYDLFNYIINTNSYYNYRNSGIESLDDSILEDTTFNQFLTIILLFVTLPILILVVIYVLFKRKRRIKKVKIVDKHKYTDMLTSLKNRNYLKDMTNQWDDAKVYPKAIIMIDLNNIKYVNDNYGHEEGDKLIISAASILVNSQLENSEIIRTDGNEFLIYLVGYRRTQVVAYCQKLTKAMKNLPYEFGAAIGYSMIEDDITTLDDAINEATLEMITAKEESK